jgi:hypothetical protein
LCFVLLQVLGIEARASYMLGKPSTTDQTPRPLIYVSYYAILRPLLGL